MADAWRRSRSPPEPRPRPPAREAPGSGGGPDGRRIRSRRIGPVWQPPVAAADNRDGDEGFAIDDGMGALRDARALSAAASSAGSTIPRRQDGGRCRSRTIPTSAPVAPVWQPPVAPEDGAARAAAPDLVTTWSAFSGLLDPKTIEDDANWGNTKKRPPTNHSKNVFDIAEFHVATSR